MRETTLTRAVLDFLHELGFIAWRQNVGVAMFKGRRVEFGFRGLADIGGILPDGKYLAVETKVGSNDLTSEQKEFLTATGKSGAVAIVARCLDDVVFALTLKGYL